MKKIISFITLCFFLVLIACQSSDEPTPQEVKPCVIVLSVASDQNNQILTLDGDVIYTAESGCSILKIAADDVDWYAVIKNGDKYNVIKNGKTVYSTDNIIKELEAYDHHFYTLQEVAFDDYRSKNCVYKDKAYQYDVQMVEITSMRINEPVMGSGNNHAEVIIEGTSPKGRGICVDGEYPELPNVNQGVNIYHTDYVHGDLAFCYRDQTTLKAMYYHQGQTHEIPDDKLAMSHLRLVNGTPYIFGHSDSTVVYAGTQRVAVLEDYMLLMKSILHNNDIYVLYNLYAPWSNGKFYVYKNMKQMEQVAAITTVKDFAVMNISK